MDNQIFTPEDILRFGKHKGKKVKKIVIDDPSYIRWMIENIENIAFREDVLYRLRVDIDLIDINKEKLNRFRAEMRRNRFKYLDSNDSFNYLEDSWYAMTNGVLGNMPYGFDGDYGFIGY